MVFHSTTLPAACLNRYGVVYVGARQATPEETAVVVREAMAAGCVKVPSGDKDIGLVWVNPPGSNQPSALNHPLF